MSYSLFGLVEAFTGTWWDQPVMLLCQLQLWPRELLLLQQWQALRASQPFELTQRTEVRYLQWLRVFATHYSAYYRQPRGWVSVDLTRQCSSPKTDAGGTTHTLHDPTALTGPLITPQKSARSLLWVVTCMALIFDITVNSGGNSSKSHNRQRMPTHSDRQKP